MFKHFAAAVFLALSMAIPASGATLECPRYQAPGKFNNHPVKWGKTDDLSTLFRTHDYAAFFMASKTSGASFPLAE